MADLSEMQSRILIIDDNVELIRLLSAILKDQGQILFATSGEVGLKLARELRPQLILLDVEMPVMDGYEVCRSLKADFDTRDAAIIFVTANTDMENEIKALEAGAVDFITKPLNPPVVCARVQTHLRLQRNATALAQLAYIDGLTGLYNRRYFDDQLDKEFQRHKRQKLPLGLAFIDIDNFKAYNDGYGHLGGDVCLAKVAQCINAATRRPGEIVARYGGEEFTVILPYTGLEDVQKYGERICAQVVGLDIAHAYSATTPHVTVSVGLTSKVPVDGDSAQQFIKNADAALYQAKSEGRNCSRIVL